MSKYIFAIFMALTFYFNCFLMRNNCSEILDVQQSIHYDSLNNIGDTDENEYSIKRYIGQEIIFLGRTKANYPQYYANFDYETPVTVDTIWAYDKKEIKLRKKSKRPLYDLVTTTSYNPVYATNEVVVLAGADGYHYDKKTTTYSFSYNKDETYVKNTRRNGYFTHYKSIEGKSFTILDVKIEQVGSGFKNFVFKLRSEDNQILLWSAEFSTQSYKRVVYPVYIKGYLDKIRQKYIGKDFYFWSSDYTGDKYHCSNISFEPLTCGYYSPYLELKSDHKTIHLPLIKTPDAFQSSPAEGIDMIYRHHNLVEALKFETDKIKAKEEQEKAEKQKQQKQQMHEELFKNGYYISINDLRFYTNSAGLLEPYITITNNSKEDIKYVTFNFYWKNGVNDIVSNSINRLETHALCKLTGYVKAYETNSGSWNSEFYNTTAKSIHISSINIIYRDGSRRTIGSQKCKELLSKLLRM